MGQERQAIRTSAIVAAAGEGRRFGGEVRKPYLELGGTPVLLRSVAALARVESVFEIIIVVNAADEEMVSARWGEELRSMKVRHITVGSALRQESVLCGLSLVDERADLVAIHDAVRPLVRPRLIRKAIEAAAAGGAAMLAAPVKATVKRAGPDLIVQETIARENLWAAQTPQVFGRELILRAYQQAERDGFTATDDAELVERLGLPVAIVESSDENIKITTPEDLIVAEALLADQDD